MSDDNDNDTMMCCASCGVAEIDDIKLTECDSCDLVRYCSDDCKQIHKSQHEEACKKRAAELRDKLLFKQPESTYLGDCPICCLPMPLDIEKSTAMNCCSKLLCDGCYVACQLGSMNSVCPFCREPAPSTIEESNELGSKRAEANDPLAMYCHGVNQYDKGERSTAFAWFTKAAEMGNLQSHFILAAIYHIGEDKDKGKFLYHLEEAAIGGEPDARYTLGCVELENGNVGRAAKHLTIGATLGDDRSTKMLMDFFKDGDISKEDYAAALRAHQAAVDATKSPQREAAGEFHRIRK